jgi:hypothetical protein
VGPSQGNLEHLAENPFSHALGRLLQEHEILGVPGDEGGDEPTAHSQLFQQGEGTATHAAVTATVGRDQRTQWPTATPMKVAVA